MQPEMTKISSFPSIKFPQSYLNILVVLFKLERIRIFELPIDYRFQNPGGARSSESIHQFFRPSTPVMAKYCELQLFSLLAEDTKKKFPYPPVAEVHLAHFLSLLPLLQIPSIQWEFTCSIP